MNKLFAVAGETNKKGQDENHLALSSCSLMDKHISTERLFRDYHYLMKMSSGTYKSLPPAFIRPIDTPWAGFEPASGLSVEDCSIQLSYQGVLSFDRYAINIDNLSNMINDVNLFILGKTAVILLTERSHECCK